MKDSKRFKVFICNIIISVLCLFSIVSYFIWPFFKLEVSVTITAEMLDSVLQGMGGESGGSNGSADGSSSDDSMGDMLANIDTQAFCAGLDPITLSLELKTVDIMAASSTDATESVKKIIDSNVNNIIDELDEPINKVVKGAIKEVSKVVVKESIKESVKESIKQSIEETLTEAELEEEVKEVLKELKVDEIIDGSIDSLIEGLSGQDVPVSQATNNIINTIDDVLTELNKNAKNSTSDNPLIAELKEIEKMTDEEKEETREELSKEIEKLADANGNVNMDNLLNELLLQLLQGGEGTGEGAGEGAIEEGGISVTVSALSATYTASESSAGLSGDEQDAKDQLKAELRKIINDAIPSEAAETIAMVMQAISYVIYFTFFTWIWLIFKILMKCRRHCNGIKLKLPIWLGWLPYLILALIPNGAISILKNPAMLEQAGISLPAEVSGIMSAIKISFFNCGFISFYIAIFLLLFGLFYYGPLRRKLKKEEKRMKKEAKKAKKLGYAVAEANGDSHDTYVGDDGNDNNVIDDNYDGDDNEE